MEKTCQKPGSGLGDSLGPVDKEKRTNEKVEIANAGIRRRHGATRTQTDGGHFNCDTEVRQNSTDNAANVDSQGRRPDREGIGDCSAEFQLALRVSPCPDPPPRSLRGKRPHVTARIRSDLHRQSCPA